MKRRPSYLIRAIKSRDEMILRLNGSLAFYEGRESDPATKNIIEARRKDLDRAFDAVDEAQARYREDGNG
jgi:hypothetical protein